MTPDALALSLAARQGGVLTLNQALDCGLSRGSVRYRLDTGAWATVSRSVYRLIEMTDTGERVKAAIAALPGAVASHETAASLHGISKVEDGRAVVSVHTTTTHTFPGVIVHRNHDLVSEHIQRIDELPVTTIPRTIVDLTQVLTQKHVRSVVDGLIADRRLTVGELRSVHEQVARRGKPGSTALRHILDERGEGPEANATLLELEGLRVLREGGAPDPVLEFAIPWDQTKRFDAAYPDHRLAIEWDSRRWHGLIDSFERDRRRDRLAVLHGWRVLRFTWKDVTERPTEVVHTVRTALDTQPPLVVSRRRTVGP